MGHIELVSYHQPGHPDRPIYYEIQLGKATLDGVVASLREAEKIGGARTVRRTINPGRNIIQDFQGPQQYSTAEVWGGEGGTARVTLIPTNPNAEHIFINDPKSGIFKRLRRPQRPKSFSVGYATPHLAIVRITQDTQGNPIYLISEYFEYVQDQPGQEVH